MAGKILNYTAKEINEILEKAKNMPAEGIKGDPGKSAYEIAKEHCYEGTESEWLRSLKGEKGDPGPAGADGKSAYEIAKAHCYEGTETEWLRSLKGEKGDKGDPGEKGDKGDKGDTGATGATGPAGADGKDGKDGQPGQDGKDGKNGQDGKNAETPNFTIGTVTTLDYGEKATVTLTGTYPNLVFNFGIPRGKDGGTPEPVEDLYMWYGRISWEEAGSKKIAYSDITSTMIKTAVAMTKAKATTMGKTTLGEEPDTHVGDYLVVCVPSSKNYTVTKDNGIGGKVKFSESVSGTADGVNITIDGQECKLYGEVLTAPSQIFFYID